MNATGHLTDDGSTLVVTRTYPARAEDVWASIVESDRLGRWFGTWTGDPAEGFVLVVMNAEEEPTEPARFDIGACEPPHLLEVVSSNEWGHWKIRLTLTESVGGTTLELRQAEVDTESVGDIGPGWEWYLDRLAAAMTGTPAPTLEAFATDYAPRGTSYLAHRRPAAATGDPEADPA